MSVAAQEIAQRGFGTPDSLDAEHMAALNGNAHSMSSDNPYGYDPEQLRMLGLSVSEYWASSRGREEERRRRAAAPRSSRSMAVQIWAECEPFEGSPVEDLLASVGLASPPPIAIRFHPELQHPSGAFAPAMVAGVSDIDGRITGIARRWLGCPLDPQQALLGQCRGGAVRLTEPGESIILTGDIEAALALSHMTGRPAWAVFGNLSAFQPPFSIRHITVPSREVASKFTGRVSAAVLKPPTDRDWLDVLSDFDERVAAVVDGGIAADEALNSTRAAYFGGVNG